MAFFRKFTEQIKDQCDDEKAIFNILRDMTLEKIPEHAKIFREGDASNNKAYIVLEGTIGIWKKPIGSVFQEDFEKLQALQGKGKKGLVFFGKRKY
jgi:CRP-like cAMP-binding protein